MQLGLYATHDIEIGHPGFNHHHIRAFAEVERHLVNRLVAVSGIHLIGLFITAFKIPRRAHGIAEGSVVDGGVFGSIRQDQRIDVALGLQRFSYGANASVHHVRGRHHIGTRTRVADRLLDEGVFGDVIQYVTIIIDDAVLSMRRVGIQGYVRNNA